MLSLFAAGEAAQAATQPIDAAFGAAPGVYHVPPTTTLLGVVDITTPRQISLDNFAVLNVQTFNVGFSGVISGANNLTLNGTTGKAILLADNTFTGIMTVASGTLQIGNGGTTGSLTASAIDGGGTSNIIFDRSDSYTYNGTLNTSATLTQAGTGTTTLGHIATSLPGPINITAGTLRLDLGLGTIGNGSLSGPITVAPTATLQVGVGAGNIAVKGSAIDNGTLAFGASTVVFSGGISGTGQVDQIGSGTTYLTANDSYTGGTIVSNGKLQVGNASTGSIVGDAFIDTNAILDFANPSLVYAGNVTGSGKFSVDFGQLIYTGTQTLTGTNVIAGATLQVGNGGTSGSISAPVLFTNGGTLVFDRSDTVTFNQSISAQSGSPAGALRVTAGTVILTGTASVGVVTVDSGATLQIGDGTTSGTPFTSSGLKTVNGTVVYNVGGPTTGGFNFSGTGTLTKTGTGSLSNVFTSTGTITLNQGSIQNQGGAINNLIINSGSFTATGTATINSATLNGGVFTGLASFGTLNNVGGTDVPGFGAVLSQSAGTFSQGAHATLSTTINGVTNTAVNVTSAATLGGTLTVAIQAPPPGVQTYTLVNSQGSLSGQFATVDITGVPAGRHAAVQYTARQVNLLIASNTDAQPYADLERTLFDSASGLNDMVYRHINGANCVEPDDAAASPKLRDCPELSVWGQPFVAGQSVDAGGMGDAFWSRSAGAMVGVDLRTEFGVTIGLAGAFQMADLKLANHGASGSLNNYAASLAIGCPLLDGRLDQNLFLSYGDSILDRAFVAGAGATTARGRVRSGVVGGSIQYSHSLWLDGFTGRVRFNLDSQRLRGFTETSPSAYTLAALPQTDSKTSGDFDIDYSHVFRLRSGALFIPEIWVGAHALFGAIDTEFLGNYAGYQPLNGAPVVSATPYDRASANFGFALTAQKTDGYAIFLRGSANIGATASQGTISVGERIVF